MDTICSPEIPRRAFIAGIAGGLLAAPLDALAQPAGKVPRIGFLQLNPGANPHLREAFLQGLRDLGYVEGRNVVIEYRSAEGKLERLPALAAEVVALRVDVIVTGGGTPTALAAKDATRTLPIVFSSATDPVTDGLVTSLARPGGNVTGLSNLAPELVGKCLEQIKETVPQVSLVAVLWQPRSVGGHTDMLKAAEVAARALGVRLQIVEARGPADFDRAFSEMTRARAGALAVLGSAIFNSERRRLVDLAAKHRLPTVYTSRDFVDAGGLMTYGPNLADLFRRAAVYVDKILKGAKPSELPVEQPTKFEMVINQDRQGARPDDPAVAPSAGGSGDRVDRRSPHRPLGLNSASGRDVIHSGAPVTQRGEGLMKFTWFNLMPWPYLPDDFREQNRSVWVDIPSKLYDPKKGHFVYHQYMDQLEYAETLGFDGIGCNEHHQNGYGLMPSPNLIAAGLARRTSRAAICVIGNSIAGYNPPIRVAEEFAMLDVISGGRLVAGFPVGTPMDTNFCYGQIPALTRDKYKEAHDMIMKAWAEDEPFAFDGKYNQLRWVNCWPKPIQKPHPPIYIPGGGSIETWDFCLDYDYNYSYLSFYGYVRGKSLLEGYWDRVAKRGKDDSPYRAAFAQIICVADTDAEAEELYAEHCLYFFNRCLHVFPPFADPPGYRTVNTIKYGALSQLRLEAQKLMANLTWKQLVDERFIIAGSPETVRQQLEECIKGLRIGHLFCLLHTGNMPDWKTRHSTKLFAEKVMPHLRNLWPEWKDDDRWWIHPMEDRLHPEEMQPGAEKPGQVWPR